jgi:uncharacterized membrane protein YvbJ
MNQEDRKAIKEIIESIMSHSVDETGLDQGHAEVLISLLCDTDTKRYARRVVEHLRSEKSASYREIASAFGGDWGLTMDGIIKAQDEGKIKLVDGKYVLVV